MSKLDRSLNWLQNVGYTSDFFSKIGSGFGENLTEFATLLKTAEYKKFAKKNVPVFIFDALKKTIHKKEIVVHFCRSYC